MAQAEVDSFVSKLKSLWHLGISNNLNVKTEGGKVSVSLEVDIGYATPLLTVFRIRSSKDPECLAELLSNDSRWEECCYQNLHIYLSILLLIPLEV